MSKFLSHRRDTVVDAMLREWGRWSRMAFTEGGAPRRHAQGSSWHHLLKLKQDDGRELSDADYVDPEPDEEICTAIDRAYRRLQADGSGYDVVIRDYYRDGTGWPPVPLLRHARYLIWRYGG